jgi:hypothetical protein
MMNRSVKFLAALGLLSVGLLIATVSLAGASRDTSAAQGATIGLLPASQNVQLGRSFTVDVVVENATNIAAFEFRIKYDPKVLKLEGVSETDFLASTGRSVVCPPPAAAEETTDAWLGCATTNINSGPPVNGSGILAHIKFSAKGPGLTYLTFVKYELSGDMSDDCCAPVSLNEASVRVIGSDEPTPENLPPTPTRNPAALTPTPISNAPTPSTWLTPEAGATPMTRMLDGAGDSARASGTTGSSSRSNPQGTSSGSPRAGEGPGESDPAWWPPLLAGLLAAAGASLLPLGLYLKGASLKRRT